MMTWHVMTWQEGGDCYMYGDLEIPFAVEEGWLRVRPSYLDLT